MHLRILILLLLTAASSAATLSEAYRLYLNGAYEASLTEYRAVLNEQSWSLDARYGVINALAMAEREAEALAFCDSLLTEGSDPVLEQKRFWLMGRMGANRALSRAALPDDAAMRHSIMTSAGWGLIDAAEYGAALSWFTNAGALGSSQSQRNGLTKAEQLWALYGTPHWSTTLYGGPVIVSNERLSEVSSEGTKSSYTYGNGWFASFESSVTVKQKHLFTLGYTHYQGSLRDIESVSEGDTIYKGDTLLTWDTVYSGQKLYAIDVDTLYKSLDQSVGGSVDLAALKSQRESEGYRLDVVVPFEKDYGNGPFQDTAWYYYKSDSLGELSELTQIPQADSYDTVDWREEYHWDSLVQWEDTVQWVDTARKAERKIEQHNLYLSYLNQRSRFDKLTLGIGCNLMSSTVGGMRKSALLWLMHKHHTALGDLAVNWYGTGMESSTMGQLSLRYSRLFKKRLLVELEPTMVRELTAGERFAIPQWQLSAELKIGWYGGRWSLFQSFCAGARAFAADSEGKNQLLITNPHRWSEGTTIALQLTKTIELFGTGRYEKYEEFSRTILYGGGTIQW